MWSKNEKKGSKILLESYNGDVIGSILINSTLLLKNYTSHLEPISEIFLFYYDLLKFITIF